MYLKKPDRFRMDYPSKGVITVWTGKLVWIYDESKNEVRLRKINASLNGPIDLFGFILKEVEKYDVSSAGEKRVSGKDCYALNLKPIREEPSQIQRLWVVKGEWYPAKIEFKIKPPEGFNKVFPNLTCLGNLLSYSNSKKSN